MPEAGNLLTIDLRGAGPLAARLNEAATLREVQRVIVKMTNIAEAKAKAGAPRDTGSLMRDISGTVRPLLGIVNMPRNLEYYKVMEYGRRPGARMPPPDALRGWAARHGMPTHRGFLFVLARSIARRGIRGRFYMRAAAQHVTGLLPAALEAAARRIEAQLASEAAGGAE